MILNINNEHLRHYAESLCQMFLGPVRFADDSDGFADIDISLTKTANGYKCMAKSNGVCKTFEFDNSRFSFLKESDVEKIALGNAFYMLGAQLYHKSPPWGILTGIRPAKFILDHQSLGISNDILRLLLSEAYLVSKENIELAFQIAKTESKYLSHSIDKTVSVYISVPFCPTKCNYCSFVSCATKKLSSLIVPYVDKLCGDIKSRAALIKKLGLRVRSVYIGGGTPSILSPSQTDSVLTAIFDSMPLCENCEITFEAGRPDTITDQIFDVLKKHRIDRVSVNPQTLSDDVLKAVGRNHTAAQFYDAYACAKKHGFAIINTDIIAGLPSDTVSSFKSTLDSIIALYPQNITVHSLSIKNAAKFRADAKKLISDTATANECVAFSKDALIKNGYLPYYIYRQKNTIGNLENIGYARIGCESAYNILMMEEIHTVIGIGAGSVTKLVSSDRKKIVRIFAPKYPYEYLGISSKKPLYSDMDIDKEISDFYCENYFAAK
ncbi:MAG: coproporphyrinogen dehydrogenase HemZ [Clostridia bacterium]|nr:coproporphyrinogen dehydrogenase HemZ [Clostridia bacterium]